MRITAQNFGPIENVEIDISPLTLVIGKNNLGKSYLAQLYYTLLDTMKMTYGADIRRRYYYRSFQEDFYPGFYERALLRRGVSASEIAPSARQIRKDTSDSEIMRVIVGRITDLYANTISRALRPSLERSFGVKVGKLVSINSNETLIGWDMFEHLSLNVHITRRGTLRVDLKLLQSGKRLIQDFQRASSDLISKLKRARTRKSMYFARLLFRLETLLMRFKTSRDQRLTWRVPGRRQSFFYIPAGRGGLLESYETVVGGLVSLSPLAPVRGLSMPPLPGMAAQFYGVLLQLRGKKGPLSRIVSGSFRELLEGDVQLKRVKGQVKSRLVYRFSSGEKTSSTDVIHAASMIKELSPIYLIVQELVEPGDFLLIEEPESHLHPGAQVRFVSIIRNLVNNGVNIFLTTHSDLFLRAVGHLVSKHDEEKGEVPLTGDSVSIYWLKDGRFGCVSQELKLSSYGALQDIPTFDEVVQDLYEEELELEKKARGRR